MSRSRPSKKPTSPKVSHLLEGLARKRGVRDLPRRFLIVCEDDASAPNYFNALRRHLNLSATAVEVAGSDGHTQPDQVVERAIILRRDAAKRSTGTVPFDEVWCVIDGDYGKKIAAARQIADKHNIKLAISTMCFEYWLLLHYVEYSKSSNACDGVVNVLKEYCSDYYKGKCDFREFMPRVEDACKRAEKLRRLRQDELPENHNPCTEIYRLVKLLRPPA